MTFSLGADWKDRPAVAVVGMGCVMPSLTGSANDVAGFAAELRRGSVAIGEIPEDRWHWQRYHGDGPDQTRCKAAAFMRDIPFDPADFGMPPSARQELHRIEQALLVAAREALGSWQPSVRERERTAVILGFMDYGTPSQRNAVLRLRTPAMRAAIEQALATHAAERAVDVMAELDARLEARPQDDVVNIYTSVAASRIAMAFDLRGPHFTVDTACSSALAAIDIAIRGLMAGRYDTVVTGAASPQVTPLMLVAQSRLGLLAAERVAPFNGDGTLLGEGVGLVVLRRLEDALRDEQKILAVVRGLGAATATDGRAHFASSPEAHVRAVTRAYERAGYAPDAVHYVEAHANGVPEGDRVERAALETVFGPHAEAQSIRIGSVKERLGYLLSGAGASGLIRTLIALDEAMLPAQLTVADDTFHDGPFHASRTPAPWPTSPGAPRRAGVSAIGFGGSHYHLALESFAADHHRPHAAVVKRSVAAAIVGMGVRLAESPDPPSFWSQVLTGRDCSRAQDDWYARSEPAVTRAATLVDASFDAVAHRIPPKTAAAIDASGLWLLAAAGDALAELPAVQRTAVVVAALPHGKTYADMELRVAWAETDHLLAEALAAEAIDPTLAHTIRADAEAHFKAPLTPLNEDSLLGYMRNVHAARIARAHRSGSHTVVVDAGCSSSCLAIDVACQLLASDEIDRAIVGGTWGGITAEYLLNTAAFGGHATEACRPFDAAADGCTPGEGAVVLVLERPGEGDAEAERAVLGSIRGVGVSANGKQASLYAVSMPSLLRAIRSALDEAGIAPEAVGLIEAHGSCTPIGDAFELGTLGRVYRHGPAVSCVKASFGHLMAAANGVSLLQLVLALRHGYAPPLPRFETPNPDLPLAELGFRIHQRAIPIDAGYGALSSYALGGVNAHIIVARGEP